MLTLAAVIKKTGPGPVFLFRSVIAKGHRPVQPYKKNRRISGRPGGID